MYTVIILNKKSLDEFSKYQPLFMSLINCGKVGICKWNESGTTVDTAVPELLELVEDKEEWNAVIVRYEDDKFMTQYEFDKNNPYDFWVNKSNSCTSLESEIPIIRLTHILGGIPKPETKFQCVEIEDKNNIRKTVYRPIIDESLLNEYEALSEKYDFDGKQPNNIIMLSMRNRKKDESIEHVWKEYSENESSEFWKRNRYPSNCRFLVKDYMKNGPVQKEQDDFNFWSAVMLLSLNDIEPSVLQAYRLYSINIEFDRELMTGCFQQKVDDLKSVRKSIELKIKRETEERLANEDELPDIKVDVSVKISTPNKKLFEIKNSIFGIFSRGVNTEITEFNKQKDKIEKILASNILDAERKLDEAADKMKEFCSYSEDEILGLNKWQRRNLINEMKVLYDDYIRIQGDLPISDVSKTEEMSSLSFKITNSLKERFSPNSFFLTLVFVLSILLLSCVPAIIDWFKYARSSLTMILGVAIAEFAISVLLSLIIVLFWKFKLNRLIKQFNLYMASAFNKLVDNASVYSKYLSTIASHSKGSSYLNLSKERKHINTDMINVSKKHLKAINILLSKIKRWSICHHINIDLDSSINEDYIYFDISTSPNSNIFYSFEDGNVYPVMLNKNGYSLQSPIEFIKQVDIIREEIYDK